MAPAIDNLSLTQEAAGLNASVARLKRKGIEKAVLQGVLWILAALLLTGVLFSAALGWWGGDALRVAGWIAVLGLGGGATAWCLWRPLRNLRGEDAVLLRIGEVYPAMASDIRSAGQLARSTENLPFSPLMTAAQIQMVRRFLNTALPEGRIFPNRRLLPPLFALLLAAAAAAAACLTIPEVLHAGFGALLSEKRPPLQIRRIVEKAPVTADLQVTLKYPAYLRRDERILENVSGGFVAPLGTTVQLTGRSLIHGADRGEIHLPDGGPVPLTVTPIGEVSGSFVVGAGGDYFLSLGTEALMVDGPSGTIDLEPDSPPAIRLLRPKGRVDLKESDGVELAFEAEDDHGIRRIDLVVRTSGTLEIRKTIVNLADGIRRFKTKYRWSPDTIRIDEASDVELELELEAFDDDTILGPKPGRSETVVVRFLTPMSRHRNALIEQNVALDALLDLLAYRLEVSVPGSRHAEEARSRYAVVRGRTEDLLAKTAKLIGLLNRDALTPKRVVDSFVQIRTDLSNQLLYEGRLYDASGLGDYKQRLGVDKVTSRLLERAIIRVDDLVIEQQMSRVVTAGAALDTARGELLSLLNRYGETRSEALRRTLLGAIEKMEKEMAELEKHIEQIRGKVGDTYINPSSLLRTDISAGLAALRKLLAAEDLDAARILVRKMKNDLQRLMAGLEGGLLSFRTERFGEGERFIGELLDRVMALEAQQLQLRRETIALKRTGLERLADMMRGKIAPLVRRQTARLDKIRRLKKDLKLGLNPAAIALSESLDAALRELGLALNQGDLDEARQTAEDVRDIIENAELGLLGGRRAATAAMKKAAADIEREIRSAYPDPQDLLSDKDRRLSLIRAVDQRKVIAKTRKLREWIRKQKEETRFLSSRALESLSQAASQMRRSVTDLEAHRAGDALQAQSDALSELAELREDLKRGGEISPIESRPQMLTGRVELPSPESFSVPPEFRDDILEAMRGDLPNSYEDAIKKYYEALVQ